jgi:hypothetical protein
MSKRDSNLILNKPQIQTTPTSRPRLWQFSLRSLLLLIVVFSVSLGLWVNNARRQKRALDAIAQLHGFVEYAHQFPDGKWSGTRVNTAEPPGPAWLRERLGDEYFVRVVGLQFWEQPVSDEDLAHVGVLTDLQYLSFVVGRQGPRITGTGLAHLRHLTRLRFLDLLGHPITDDGLRRLHSLTELETIDLRNTEITDKGLEQLTRFKRLRHVALDNTRISDAGLEHLGNLLHLQRLVLRNTKVTDDGVQNLQAVLPNCKIVR